MESTVLAIQQQFGVQLHNIICKKVGHHNDCHDIMQEVYLKIMLQLPRIVQARNRAGYLVQLTNNAVVDYYRRSKTVASVAFQESETLSATDGNDEPTAQSMQLADCCLRPMIDSLPAIYRDALIRTELEGMKLKVFAEYTGISLSNAKVRVQRAKEQLKNIILQCCNYEFDSYGNIVECIKYNQVSCCKK